MDDDLLGLAARRATQIEKISKIIFKDLHPACVEISDDFLLLFSILIIPKIIARMP